MRRTTWSVTDGGSLAAYRNDDRLGHIERTASGHFIAFDGGHSPIGRYDSLANAQRSVARAARRILSVAPRGMRRAGTGARPGFWRIWRDALFGTADTV